MGERKVLNKYYPPDFNPQKLPKRKRLKNEQMKVVMMLPMSIRCSTCGEYMSKGNKCNSRKEDVPEDAYLGLMVFSFYIKCHRCAAEMSFKTDLQNNDHVVEGGATRNYEPWREKDQAVADATKKREEEERGDAMKVLENRTYDSKVEMDILSALDEMKSIRSRQATVDTDAMLEALKRTQQERGQELDEADEKLIQSVFQNGSTFVRRTDDDATLANGLPSRTHKRGREADPLVTTAAAVEAQADIPSEDDVATTSASQEVAAPPNGPVSSTTSAGPTYAVRPKAVTFVSRPKVAVNAASLLPTKASAGGASGTGKSVDSNGQTSGTEAVDTGLASLAAAYSDSEDD